MKKTISKNPLFFAFITPAVTDTILTILGQDPAYWTNHRIINEASPVYFFLLISPFVYIIGSLIWYIFWYWALKHLKEPFNLAVTLLFLIGHSWGSSSWIHKFLLDKRIYNLFSQNSIMFGWSLIILYFVVISSIATYCLRIYMNQKKNG